MLLWHWMQKVSVNRHLPFIEEKISGLSMPERYIMLKIARFSAGNGRGQLDASQDTLAGWMGVSTRTVQRAVSRLVRFGVVEKARGFSSPNTLRFSTLYWRHYNENLPMVLVDYSSDKMSSHKRQIGGTVCDKLADTIRQNGGLPIRTDPFDYQELPDCNYKKGFPSLHYASVNLVAMPKDLSVIDVFPSGGVL